MKKMKVFAAIAALTLGYTFVPGSALAETVNGNHPTAYDNPGNSNYNNPDDSNYNNPGNSNYNNPDDSNYNIPTIKTDRDVQIIVKDTHGNVVTNLNKVKYGYTLYFQISPHRNQSSGTEKLTGEIHSNPVKLGTKTVSYKDGVTFTHKVSCELEPGVHHADFREDIWGNGGTQIDGNTKFTIDDKFENCKLTITPVSPGAGAGETSLPHTGADVASTILGAFFLISAGGAAVAYRRYNA